MRRQVRAPARAVRRRWVCIPALAAAALLAGGSGAASAQDPAPPPADVRLTIGVGGDLLPHLPLVARARAYGNGRYDFRPMFRRIRPWIQANDLAFCHLETTLSTAYPRFNSPRALARAIKATGYDACDTASNHTLDRGQRGVVSTRRALDRAGVPHTGSFSSARQRRRILMLDAKGVRVAYLAYTQMTNGIGLPHPWSVNLASARRITRDARRARRAGARVVIVNLHWGTEYRRAPDAFQTALTRRLARAPAVTAVVGQRAHVVQPIRRIDGKWIVFGTGNLLSNQTGACCPLETQDGMLVRLHLRVGAERERVDRISYTPTWVRHPDFTVFRAGRTNRASYRRTVAVAGRARHLRPLP